MTDEKDTGEMEIPAGDPLPETPKTSDSEKIAASNENESRDIFDLGLDTKSSFRLLRKNVRHYIAHEEYGVLFSFCGVRITKKHVDYNPEERTGDLRCEKCKQHIWQNVAAAAYAKRMKEKKDLGD